MLGRKKKISPFLSDHKQDGLGPAPSKGAIKLNPLAMFPSRRDPLANGLFNQNMKVPGQMLSRTADDAQWLESGKINVGFGVTSVSI